MNPDQVGQGNLFALLEDRVSVGATHDMVRLGNVLEHVTNPVELLRALHAIPKPLGLLVAIARKDGSVYHEMLLENGAIPQRFWITWHLSHAIVLRPRQRRRTGRSAIFRVTSRLTCSSAMARPITSLIRRSVQQPMPQR